MTKNQRMKVLILTLGAAIAADLFVSGVGCPVYALFGVCCPGCGMTRAVLACLRLDWKAAFLWHPMVFFLPVLLLWFWRDGRVFRQKALNIGVPAGIAAGFVLVWLARI
jgi:hypothetical protein